MREETSSNLGRFQSFKQISPHACCEVNMFSGKEPLRSLSCDAACNHRDWTPHRKATGAQ